MNYVRLFAGPDGESHFEDVAVDFFSEPPQPFLVSEWQSAERVRFLSFPEGFAGGRHLAPFRQFLICLAGSYAMQTSDGETRHFRPGDVLLVEDIRGQGHKTWIEGSGTAMAARIKLPN